MATISSMASNTYTIYKMAQSNGLSLFGSNSNTNSASGSLLGSVQNSNVNADSSISRMWSNYTSSTNHASDGIYTLASVNSGLSEVVSSYYKDADSFYTQYDSAMSDLAGAAGALQKADFTITTGATDEDGKAVIDQDKLNSVVKNVTNFANAYNDALGTLSDNADVSLKAKSLATRFADTTKFHENTYEKYGINVDSSTGKLSVNKEKLTKALASDPETSAYVLGKDLAGRAGDNAITAQAQRDSVYPSITSAIGNTIKQASVYGGGTISKMTAYNNIGNLLDMAF